MLCDIQKLFTGEGIARVIKNDPMMSQIMSGSALVYGETENPGKIRPRHFKRLVTYAKIALNIYFGNFASETKAGRMKALKINGKYDSELKAAVAKFQTEMGIPSCTDLQKGECMGKTIFGTLAVKVKYTKQELIAKLDEFKKSFDEKNSGKSYPVAYFHMGEFQRGEYADAQSVLFEALKWLGKISPNLRLVRIAHRENAEQALKEICMNYGTIPGNFGSSSLNIGGSVIADVIRELKAAK